MTDRELLQQSLDAHMYHRGQTRPIDRTDAVIEALRTRLAQPAPAVPADPWKSAVIDRIAATCMDAPQDEPPASILRRIIDWEVAVALDPAVSDAAQALIDKGAAAPVVREPMSEEQIVFAFRRGIATWMTPGTAFAAGARSAERHHGITGGGK